MITTLTYLTIIVFYLSANSVEKIVGAALHVEFCQEIWYCQNREGKHLRLYWTSQLRSHAALTTLF